MAAGQYRRVRGTPKVPLNLFVAPHVRERIDIISSNADMPIWAVIESAIMATQLDANGVPENWDVPSEAPISLPGISTGGAKVP